MRLPGPSDRALTLLVATAFVGVLLALGGPQLGLFLIGGAVALVVILLVMALLGFDF